MEADLDVIPSQLKAIQSEVLEFNVGVSHIALDEERERNTRIRERIESIIAALEKNRSSAGRIELEKAQRLLSVATGNTETLRYLESISCLEGIFTDVTKAATVTAVDLSKESRIPQKVLSTRLLSDNVKHCWEYTAQLSHLTATHLNAAADFHMFNHEVNEIRAHARHMKKLSGKLLNAFSPEGRIGEASKLSSEMNDRLQIFGNLAERARHLTMKAPSIVPIANRLLEIQNGKAKGIDHSEPVMAQLLINYVGSNFTVKKGESVALIDTTENPYLWKVQTSGGPQYIPSIACIVASANTEQMADAYWTLVEVRDSWKEALTNYKRQLVIYYTKYLESIGQCSGIHVTDAQGLRQFMNDLDELLVRASLDDGRLSSVFSHVSSKMTPRIDCADEVWNRSELNVLHQPLIMLNDHFQTVKKMDENTSIFSHRMNEYVSTVHSEAKGLNAQLENLRNTHEHHRAELKELYSRVQNWKSTYEESIEGPAYGVGRLVLSSLSSSSGISSDAYMTIPHPPSPFGRITPTEMTPTSDISSEDPMREFLDTQTHEHGQRTRIHVLPEPEEVYMEESRVFTGGASIQPKQIQAGVNVKQKWAPSPKMVRDVATQIRFRRTIQNTQTDLRNESLGQKFASTQSETHRVDCMTQIGVMKAPKAQQVDVDLISATMQVEGQRQTQMGLEGTSGRRAESSFSTGAPKDTTALLGLATRPIPTQDLMTQVGEMRPRGAFQVAGPEIETGEVAAKAPSIGSTKLQINPTFGEGEYATMRRQYDTMTQIQPIMHTNTFEAPKADIESVTMGAEQSITSGNLGTSPIQQNEYGAQVAVRSHIAEMEFRPPEHITGTHESQLRLNRSGSVGSFRAASLNMEATQREPARRDVEAQIFYTPKATAVHDGRIRYTDASHQATVHSAAYHTQANRAPPIHGEFVGPRVKRRTGSISRNGNREAIQGELTTSEPSVNDADMQVNRPGFMHMTTTTRPRVRIAAECTCLELCASELQTSVSRPGVTSYSCALHSPISFHVAPPCYARCETPRTVHQIVSGHRTEAVSCQVGTKLVPKKVKVSTVSVGVDNKLIAGKLGLPVNSLLCPASVECHPVLTDEPGIHIASLKETGQVDIQTRDGSFVAGVQASSRRQLSNVTQTDEAEACVLEFNTSDVETGLGSVTFTRRTRNNSTMAQQVLTDSECQFTIGGMNNRVIESTIANSIYEPVYAATSVPLRRLSHASCQVGSLLVPETLQVSAVPLLLNSAEGATRPELAVDAVICPTKVQMKSILQETAGITVAEMQDTRHMNVKIAEKMYDASVQRSSRVFSQQSIVNGRSPLCTLELNTAGLIKPSTDSQATSTSTGAMSEAAFVISLKSPQEKTILNQSFSCPTCHGQFETSWTSTTSAESAEIGTGGRDWLSMSTATSTTSASTQVGATLTPTSLQLVNINVKPRDNSTARNVGLGVNNVICPSTVNLVSELCEASGINVKGINEVASMSLLSQGSVYRADVRRGAEIGTTSNAHKRALVNLCRGKDGLVLGEVTDRIQKFKDTGTHAVALEQAGCEFEVVNAEMGALCNFCGGAGLKVATQIRSQERLATSTSSTNQPVAYQNIKSPLISNKECQVGTVLKPTCVQLASIEMRMRNAEIAKKVGLTADAVICPSNVRLKSELTETGGIEVMNVKDVGNLEIVAGHSLFDANVNASPATRQASFAGKPLLSHLDIQGGRSGPTIGQMNSQRGRVSGMQNTEGLVLQDVGCVFTLKEARIGNVCHTCMGSGVVGHSSAESSSIGSSSTTDYNRKPSFLHQRASTPVSKSVECQVGTRLRPASIKIANIGIKPRSTVVAQQLGMNVESVLCPVKLQVEPELTELPGIEIVDFVDVKNIDVQAGEAAIDADIQTRKLKAYSNQPNSRRMSIQQMNIVGGRSGLTLGQAAVSMDRGTANATAEIFTLQDIGCEIALSNTAIGTVCNLCHGRGKTFSASTRAIPKTVGTSRVDAYRQQMMPNMSMSSSSKSCQVGTVLTPTSVHVAGVEMVSMQTSESIPRRTIVYPAAVEVRSQLTESSGIHLTDVANMETVDINIGERPCIAIIQNQRPIRTENCVLEVRSFHPEAVRGELSTYRMAVGSQASSGKFVLKNIGCEFRVIDGGTSSTPSRHHRLANFETEPLFESARPANASKPNFKNIACQVGTMLVPTTVQVADISALVTDQRMATSLGLKANAILCPSTVNLDTKLTDTSGIQVVDVRDVKELGITVGNMKSAISVASRNTGVRGLSAAFEKPEPAYLTFTSRQSASLVETRAMFNRPSETSITPPLNKLIDHNAGCTFRITQNATPLHDGTFVTKQLRSVRNSGVSNTKGEQSVYCQVGVTMVPGKMNVSPVKVNIEDRASADMLGVSVGSTLQPLTLELQAQISDKAGIDIAQMNVIDQMEIQIGTEKFSAAVEGSNQKGKSVGVSGSWGRQFISKSLGGPQQFATSTAFGAPRAVTSVGQIGPYLIAQKGSGLGAQKESVLEVSGLTMGGKHILLKVNADLRGKIHMKTGQVVANGSGGSKFTGYLDSSRRLSSPIDPADRFMPKRSNSRLCDVACEALIKPNTMEKRLQTTTF